MACLQVVNETDATHADAGGELLNAFNVATFKSEEDDAAFWNRLIPTKERAPSEEPEQLGIRAARLKTVDDVRPLHTHPFHLHLGFTFHSSFGPFIYVYDKPCTQILPAMA